MFYTLKHTDWPGVYQRTRTNYDTTVQGPLALARRQEAGLIGSARAVARREELNDYHEMVAIFNPIFLWTSQQMLSVYWEPKHGFIFIYGFKGYRYSGSGEVFLSFSSSMVHKSVGAFKDVKREAGYADMADSPRGYNVADCTRLCNFLNQSSLQWVCLVDRLSTQVAESK